jgi:hypothetical protein
LKVPNVVAPLNLRIGAKDKNKNNENCTFKFETNDPQQFMLAILI